MILLLGATGYIGQAFARELRRRRLSFIPLSRSAFDYTRFDLLFDYVRRIRPDFLINAAGFGGYPNIDSCEVDRMRTFQANTLLPQTISRVCMMTNTAWGHVSSGCIYTGGKVFHTGQLRVEKDLNKPELRELFASEPRCFFGFTEVDEPNFTFRRAPCSFLAGAKALAEESIRGGTKTFIWRARLPFGETSSPCNLLTKLQTYPKILDHITSLSHVDDFGRAALDLWETRAPYGIYNIVNPGFITTGRIAQEIRRVLRLEHDFTFWRSDEEFYAQSGSRAQRSFSILDVTKLLGTGIRLRPVQEALEDSLARWQPGDQAFGRLGIRKEPVSAAV